MGARALSSFCLGLGCGCLCLNALIALWVWRAAAATAQTRLICAVCLGVALISLVLNAVAWVAVRRDDETPSSARRCRRVRCGQDDALSFS
jgi:hypothetical protein